MLGTSKEGALSCYIGLDGPSIHLFNTKTQHTPTLTLLPTWSPQLVEVLYLDFSLMG